MTKLDEAISKPCPRCGGSGRYSFNYRDGDTCLRCGGVGRIVDPKKNPRIKPTLPENDLRHAWPGDILKYGGILYRIAEVRWVSFEEARERYVARQVDQQRGLSAIDAVEEARLAEHLRTYYPGIKGNQYLVAERLVDGKRFRLYRNAFDRATRFEFRAPRDWHGAPVEQPTDETPWKL